MSKKTEIRKPPRPPSNKREHRMTARRERKFAENDIRIEEGKFYDADSQGRSVSFTHAVWHGRARVGTVNSRRSALKRAHQFCRDASGKGRARG